MLPGAGYGGYLKLSELVAKGTLLFNEVLLEYEDGNVFANGKIIQGVHIQEKVVRITGIHYTSWENATQIRSMLRIEPSLQDPFVYISAPGSMTGWAEEEIKRELGTRAADSEVCVRIVMPLDLVWLKCSRKVVHLAIAGIVSEMNIQNLQIKRVEQARYGS
ncbi:MAG TPA: hypothetical protein VJJ82_00255 [Candidatus Nanoarchaeia archaeon]|nr:hypothetical protein [Candidatus Nanoarchaeia archaeon]